MPWTEITRAQYRREGRRYASDASDAEWALIERWLPAPRRLGRPRRTDLREVVNAFLYILATGCQWRALPRDFPPRQTVQGYFYAWRDDGTWQALVHALGREARTAMGRDPVPSAGVIDSQSVRTTESGGPRGRDVFKRLCGRKRHIVTDLQGFPLLIQVHPADVQDSHGAVPLLKALRASIPTLSLVFADRGYRGSKMLDALADSGPWTVQIVQRPAGVKGFQLLPRRWVVERTLAWLGRSRRLAKDFEATLESALAWVNLAAVRLLTRRIARA